MENVAGVIIYTTYSMRDIMTICIGVNHMTSNKTSKEKLKCFREQYANRTPEQIKARRDYLHLRRFKTALHNSGDVK